MTKEVKHTKGCWSVCAHCTESDAVDIKTESGWFLRISAGARFSTFDDPEGVEAEFVANAARIVACVNACAGMDDPVQRIKELKHLAAEAADEGGSYGGGKTIIEIERDQLLATLVDLESAYVQLLHKGAERIIDAGGTCDSVERMILGDHRLAEARAVIAKVRS